MRESRAKLERSWISADEEEALRLLDGLAAMGGDLAKDSWKGIHAGTASEIALTLTVLRLRIIDKDLRAQGQDRPHL